MSLLSEADVIQFRMEYYALLSRLLAVEPDETMVEALQSGLDERAVGAAQVHSLMGDGWRTLGEHIGKSLDDLIDEFTRIFLGPYGTMINPYESIYLAGKGYSQPLADVRGFLQQHGLESGQNERNEPEDSLAFELGAMQQLIARQQASGDAEPSDFIEAQRSFLAHHLLVWAPLCAGDIEANPDAAFYKGVAQILTGFLEVERDFFAEDGGIEVESVEAARKRYYAEGFKGPVFDAEPLTGGAPLTEADE